MTFIPFIGLQTFKVMLFLKTHCGAIFKITCKQKYLPRIPILGFFSVYYNHKEVRVLTNLFFFSFRLADDQKSFNAACNNYGFLYYFEILSFLSSNNTPARASPVIDHLGSKCTSNKMSCSPTHVSDKIN